jgi:hypothetical protein
VAELADARDSPANPPQAADGIEVSIPAQ